MTTVSTRPVPHAVSAYPTRCYYSLGVRETPWTVVQGTHGPWTIVHGSDTSWTTVHGSETHIMDYSSWVPQTP